MIYSHPSTKKKRYRYINFLIEYMIY